MFHKILIANRGEIAVRIIRSAKALGYCTVAVYSEADRSAPHVRLADQAVAIGASPPGESYLSSKRLLAAARHAGADAVHPGYGFLSENADFAAACRQAGLTFIGPSAEAIRLMGNKAAAKRRMQEASIPCVPGYQGAAQDDATFMREAEALGYPLMVKAAAGGGGRGMRLVHEPVQLLEALAAARSEARNAFGADELILERALLRPRHVEIQVFGDSHGNVIHLGERDCSIQRRHQKVIEEAPSPAVTPALRERMGAAAVAAARAIGYIGAGTVEFLLDEDGQFYFLEMNTRLQVEHPVTEMITGLDLVAWQLAVAAGEPLPLAQDEVRLVGHAIEARLYAEDPYQGFLPQAGKVTVWVPPTGPGVRVDAGIESGSVVTSYYDPMLAKVVACGTSREEARRRLLRALEDCRLLGLPTNRAFLADCLENPAFIRGEATTSFIDSQFPEPAQPVPDTSVLALAAALLYQQGRANASSPLTDWRSTGPAAVPLLLNSGSGQMRTEVTALGGQRYRISLDGCQHEVALLEIGDSHLRVELDGLQQNAGYAMADGTLHLALGRQTFSIHDGLLAAATESPDSDGRVLASMSGTITAVHVGEHDRVCRGQPLVVLEAMKMEHQITAPVDGVVAVVAVSVGKQVANRTLLMELAPAAEPPE